MGSHPEWARRGIRLRQFGQEVIEQLGGRKIHPVWAIPGGVRSGLSADGRDRIRLLFPEAMEAARSALADWKGLLDRFQEEAAAFGDFPSLFLGHVGPNGEWEHYDGKLRLTAADGTIVADQVEPSRYAELFAEVVEPDSFLKSPYYRPLGMDDGSYRVGPLARLNICSHFGTPSADAELGEYRQRLGRTVTSSFHFHYARLLEIFAAIERIGQTLDDATLTGTRIQAHAGVNRLEAVGAGEAPRGTLFHHYRVDEDGKVLFVNLLIATGQNNRAMNQTVAQIARRYIRGPKIPEGMLNRVEAGIRAFDPCLSCSTHAVGAMPIRIRLVGPEGDLLDEVVRDA
jgi:NAD-reducing hydrogenase large subunit